MKSRCTLLCRARFRLKSAQRYNSVLKRSIVYPLDFVSTIASHSTLEILLHPPKIGTERWVSEHVWLTSYTSCLLWPTGQTVVIFGPGSITFHAFDWNLLGRNWRGFLHMEMRCSLPNIVCAPVRPLDPASVQTGVSHLPSPNVKTVAALLKVVDQMHFKNSAVQLQCILSASRLQCLQVRIGNLVKGSGL